MKRNKIIYIQAKTFFVIALNWEPTHFQLVVFATNESLTVSNEGVEAFGELLFQTDQLVKLQP